MRTNASVAMAKSYLKLDKIYGGIPLTERFLRVGNDALETYGVMAELRNGRILIPFRERSLFTRDELTEMNDDNQDPVEMGSWRIRISAVIVLDGDPGNGIRRTSYEYTIITPDGEEGLEEYYDIRKDECAQGVELIEAFLNATVKASIAA